MKKQFAQEIVFRVSRDYNAVSDAFSRARLKSWTEMEFLFEKYIKEKDSVLDLGCGNGRFYPLVEKRKAFYIGVDNSQKLVDIAKEKYPQVNFYVADALNLSFPDDTFNQIFSMAVFHHIPSVDFRKKFLSECKRVLKPEGLLIVTVWNLWQSPKGKKEIFKNVLARLTGKSKLDFGDIEINWHGTSNCYFHCFRANELKKLVQESGFQIIDFGKINLKNKKAFSNFFIVGKNF